MEQDLKLGSTVWIEHKDTGDVYYRVKIINERQPGNLEVCHVCHRGQVILMGHVIQTGLLDDKIFAVMNCERCCAVTVFIYHVEHSVLVLPERADCNGETF